MVRCLMSCTVPCCSWWMCSTGCRWIAQARYTWCLKPVQVSGHAIERAATKSNIEQRQKPPDNLLVSSQVKSRSSIKRRRPALPSLHSTSILDELKAVLFVGKFDVRSVRLADHFLMHPTYLLTLIPIIYIYSLGCQYQYFYSRGQSSAD